MDKEQKIIIDKLFTDGDKVTPREFTLLIDNRDKETTALIRERAVEIRKKIYGNKVYIRGLIEISNYCRNDCYYCGIRRSNSSVSRYRLDMPEILKCVAAGYELGFRTFVLQGGEDSYYSDDLLCGMLRYIKKAYPGCAVTLSLGERGEVSYEKLKAAGADRYLLRHETADEAHYRRLHPQEMSFQNRMECLAVLKKLGYQTGCGFMVGSPGQTMENLGEEMGFIRSFRPQMCGIGPFIPHRDTPFRDRPPGSVELTCFLLSLIRIIHPAVLLPATTALGSLAEGGRELGILSGANVLMPNLSPGYARDNYMLYNNKLSSGTEAAENLRLLKQNISDIGYEIVTDRGDAPSET